MELPPLVLLVIIARAGKILHLYTHTHTHTHTRARTHAHSRLTSETKNMKRQKKQFFINYRNWAIRKHQLYIVSYKLMSCFLIGGDLGEYPATLP